MIVIVRLFSTITAFVFVIRDVTFERYGPLYSRYGRYGRNERYKSRDYCSKWSFFAFKGPFIGKNEAKLLLFGTKITVFVMDVMDVITVRSV